MRLIDADKLQEFFLKRINNDYDGELVTEICEIIDNQPTAYDVDKVIEQLKEEGCIVDNEVGNRVIEIVKAGGKE